MIDLKEVIKRYEMHQKELPRIQRLNDYYLNKNKIYKRKQRPNEAITHRVAHNYANAITTQATGYFISKNIDYVCPDEDGYMELGRILKVNDEPSHNSDLAMDMSVYGKAYELIYTDEKAMLHFARVEPSKVIVVYDSKIKPAITTAIVIDNYEKDVDTNVLSLEVYDEVEVVRYEAEQNKLLSCDVILQQNYFKEVGRRNHNLGYCPVVEYKNNEFKTGDFEKVIDLIDSYDLLNSLSLDDSVDFTNAYLVLTGLGELSDELAEQIRNAKILSLDENGKAEWLIKNINSEFVEGLKSRINRDIHKFSFTVDMTDPALYNGTISGIAIKFKFQALEQLRAEKEKQFRRSLMRRLEIIQEYLKKLGTSIDIYDIDIRFSANLPVNNQEEVSTAVAVSGIVSRKTQLSILPFVDDVENELSLLEEEKANEVEVYANEFKNGVTNEE